MIIKETPRTGGQHKVYRVPDVDYSKSGLFQKWATQVNTFFHRSARDKIRYNLTNLRIFTETEDKTYELELKEFYAHLPHWKPIEIIDCSTLDDFFGKIGFDYRAKAWLDQNERSMKAKDLLI